MRAHKKTGRVKAAWQAGRRDAVVHCRVLRDYDP